MAADTQTLKYIIQFSVADANIAAKSIDYVNKQIGVTNATMKEATISSGNFGGSMWKIAQRAMLTIPVWMALRTAMQQTFKVITDGVQQILDLDEAMRKMQAVSGSLGQNKGFNAELMKNVLDLSGRTGKTVKEISDTYIAFAETGMNATLAQQGMNTALKLAVGTFNDTKNTARILVDMYNMFGSSMDKALSPAQKMELIAGDLVSLWKDNSGTLQEYIDGLRQFAPVAKANNLSMQETLTTLVVLNNYMQRGSQGGTQLARAFQDMQKNMPKIAELGVKLTPGGGMENYLVILNKLAAMDPTKRFAWLNSIFGQRSQKGTGALGMADALERLITQLDKVKNMDAATALKVLNENFELQNNKLRAQADAFDKLRKQASAAFLEGLTGATNEQEALDKIGVSLEHINDVMRKDVIPAMRDFGAILTTVFNNESLAFFTRGLGNILSIMKDLAALGLLPQLISKFGSLPSQQERLLAEATAGGKAGKPITDYLPYLGKNYNPNTVSEDMKNVAMFSHGVTATQISQAYRQGVEAVKAEKIAGQIPGSTLGASSVSVEDLTPKTELIYAERLKALGYDTLQIEIEKWRIIERTSHDELKTKEQGLKVLEAQVALVNEYAAIVQKNLEGSITKVMQGQAGAKSILTSMQTSAVQGYQKTVSEGLTNMILSTGIGEMFGMSMASLKGMFGGVSGQIESAFDSGGKQTYSWIVRGFNDATKGTVNPAIMAQGGGVGGFMGSAGFSGGAFGGFASRFASSTALSWGAGASTGPLTYVTPYGASKGYTVGSTVTQPSNSLTWGQVGSSALLGYSAYQSSKAAGASAGVSAVSGIGMGLGSALLASGLGAATA